MHRLNSIARPVLALLALLLVPAVSFGLSDNFKKLLADSKYVYISTQRKDGNLGKPAEIWFLYHNDAVYVASLPTSWRAKRIKWHRTMAKVAVGKADGPSFMATGAIVKEPATEKVLLETFAKKYADGWSKHGEGFQKGFQDGSRVLIKYTPN